MRTRLSDFAIGSKCNAPFTGEPAVHRVLDPPQRRHLWDAPCVDGRFERDLSSRHQNFTDPRNRRRLRKLKEDEQRAQNDIGWLMSA